MGYAYMKRIVKPKHPHAPIAAARLWRHMVAHDCLGCCDDDTPVPMCMCKQQSLIYADIVLKDCWDVVDAEFKWMDQRYIATVVVALLIIGSLFLARLT